MKNLLCTLGCAATVMPAIAQAYEYPTVDRVLYVESCMATHPGNRFEMVNKCSCALDAIAKEVSFDDYTTMATAANATTIGGERGSYIRDVESLQDQIKRYKALQAKVMKGCFISDTK